MNTPPLSNNALLTRNTLINITGQGVPLLIAIFAVPLIIQKTGLDRFGILTIIWLIIGYFGLFDFGLGRAVTQKIAHSLAVGEQSTIPGLLSSALYLTVALGVIAAVFLFWYSSALVSQVLRVPPELRHETASALRLMAFSLPAALSMTCLQGYLEAVQRFDLVNRTKATLGSFTVLTPLLILPFSSSLIPIVAALVLGKIVAFAVFFFLCRRSLSTLRHTSIIPSLSTIANLFKLGGWMTVSNIIGPLMVYLDRFLIGSMISLAAVAYYATPYEVVTKLWVIPFSVVGVLFPAFAMGYGRHNNDYLTCLFDRWQRYLFLGLSPIAFIIITFAHEGLTIWLGNKFAANSTVTMQLLMFGVFINSLALIPYTLIQAVGRPDLTAKLHLLELPLYLALLLWLLKHYGIEGAAVAWVGRILIDTVALYCLMAKKILPEAGKAIKKIGLAVLVSCILASLPACLTQLPLKLMSASLVLVVFLCASWSLLLETEEKHIIKNLFLRSSST
jgi:O-antigen/teichoic acid export membrane protein